MPKPKGASIQRCWSTWNVLCTYLYTAELIASNPMPMVGRPKLAKTLSKALPADALVVIREWSPKMDGIAGTIWASQTTSSTWPPRHL